MTKAQRITLMADWWPAACRAQGWQPGDREQRLAVLAQAVGRPLTSASDLNSTSDVDRVRVHLQTLADNVSAAMEQEHEGPARRQRVALDEILRCLALYHPDPEGYVREVIRDKFARGRRDRPARDLHAPLPTMDDLSTQPRLWTNPRTGQVVELASELEQLLMTITRAVNGKNGMRNAAGHSLHDMRTRAGLRCSCAHCSRYGQRPALAPAPAPVVPVAEEEVVGEGNPF